MALLSLAGRVPLSSVSSVSVCSSSSSCSSSRASELFQKSGITIRAAREVRGVGRNQRTVSSSAVQPTEQGVLPVLRRHFLAGTAAFVALSTARIQRASADASAQATVRSESGDGKTVFVAGATGNTGKRIVKELLAKGFSVRAGVRDVAKAKQVLPTGENIDFVLADVTQGAEKLAQAIKGVDAVVVATGFRPSITDPFASWNVDNLGTVALVDASGKAGVKRFVLVSSILVNGAAKGQFLNPAYIILNLLGLTLIAKLQAENYIRKSGIEYTIIRPGGLKNDVPSGNLILAPEDTLFGGSVSRDSVAQVAVDSLLYPEASFKVVELIAEPDAPVKSVQELLAAIPA